MRSLQDIPVIKTFFYGNYFYGLCAIALSVEASVQQQFPVNPIGYYIGIFCFTVVYYTRAYITNSSGDPSEERSLWYYNNRNAAQWSQYILGSIGFGIFAFFLYHNYQILQVSLLPLEIFLLVIFPLVAALYYGVNERINLRRLGWMKPFIIGFSWAGVVTFYPVIYYHSYLMPQEFYKTQDAFGPLTIVSALLFLKNFMFISVLCIMFDIKDYVSDSNMQLETFIVRLGLRKTIFYVILPLCVLGLGTFIAFGLTRHFSFMKITFNVLPFALLIWVAYSLHQRRSLFYYLSVVDGLMLVKGIFGTIGMVYFS